MRTDVVEYYNDEIMDNLIRAKNGQPFVHVDVTALSAVTGTKIGGTINAGQTLNNSGTRQVNNQTVTTNNLDQNKTFVGGIVTTTVQTLGTIGHLAVRPFTVAISPERSDNVTVASSTVLGEKGAAVYALYLSFLNLKNNTEQLSVANKSVGNFDYLANGSSSVLTACTIAERLKLKFGDYVPGTVKERNGCLYYVPFEFRRQYLDLCYRILTEGRPPPPGQFQLIGGAAN